MLVEGCGWPPLRDSRQGSRLPRLLPAVFKHSQPCTPGRQQRYLVGARLKQVLPWARPTAFGSLCAQVLQVRATASAQECAGSLWLRARQLVSLDGRTGVRQAPKMATTTIVVVTHARARL